MPNRPNIVMGAGRCPEHRRGASSGSSANGSKWARIRNAYIAEHSVCQDCGRDGPWLDAHHVDHARPGDPTFLDSRNLRTDCRACHREVTERAEQEARGRPTH
jgi:5-methylcytosine-specific restriction protein A